MSSATTQNQAGAGGCKTQGGHGEEVQPRVSRSLLCADQGLPRCSSDLYWLWVEAQQAVHTQRMHIPNLILDLWFTLKCTTNVNCSRVSYKKATDEQKMVLGIGWNGRQTHCDTSAQRL